MLRGDRPLVRWRSSANGQRRLYIDFGRRWAPRFLYPYRGTRFETPDFAVGVLSPVEVEVRDRQPRTLRDYKRWAVLHEYQTSPGYTGKN